MIYFPQTVETESMKVTEFSRPAFDFVQVKVVLAYFILLLYNRLSKK